jgi:hypothetical protein
MHRQAMEAAHNLLNQHQAIEKSLSKVAKDARRRRAKVIALGCILALLAMILA